MTQPFYFTLMSLVERSKHSGQRSPFKLVRAFRHYKYIVLSTIANWLITRAKVQKSIDNVYRNKKITASLTTFPARIEQVRYAILSIILQTERPDRIILWLAREQFPEETVPDNLRDLCQYGLEIRFCDDLRSHKKYYYALQEQNRDEVVITFDDDIIYHPHTIERLIKKHNEFPDCIVCSQVHVMTFQRDGSIKPYNQWDSYQEGMFNPNVDFMPLTGSGCLYPYKTMPNITFDKHKIRNYAFSADDLWIGYLARITNVKICIVDNPARIFSVVKSSQVQHLGQINCIEDGNDKTIQALSSELGSLKR